MSHFEPKKVSKIKGLRSVSTVRSIISFGKKGPKLMEAPEKLKSYKKSSETDLKDKRIQIVKKLAGRFMIVSNTDLSISDIVKD